MFKFQKFRSVIRPDSGPLHMKNSKTIIPANFSTENKLYIPQNSTTPKQIQNYHATKKVFFINFEYVMLLPNPILKYLLLLFNDLSKIIYVRHIFRFNFLIF